MTVVLRHAFVAWCLLLVLMFGNGTFRALVLQPRFGEERARQLASISGIAIVFGMATLFVSRMGPTSSGTRLAVGILWLGLTLLFELGFGRYVSHASWETLLSDYDVLHGRLWPFVLLATLVAPWLCGALRHRT